MSVYVRARHLRVGEHIATSGQLSSFGTIGRAEVGAMDMFPEGEDGRQWVALSLVADPDATPWNLTMLADAVVLLAPDEEIRG